MKYHPDQLRAMARHAITARDAQDERYLRLLVQLAVRCGMDPNEVDRRIVAMAA